MARKKDNEPKDDNALLKAAQALVEAERSLTAALEEAEPWLSSYSNSGRASSQRGPFVRPLPSNMEQVDQVLAVARNLAARTSAPAGWNPPAPVVGFATPNPLPHQLRGGALGSLQLERAKEQLQKEQRRKRQRQEEEEKEQTALELQQGQQKRKSPSSEEQPTEAMQVDTDDSKIKDPKRKEVADYEKQLARSEEDLSSSIHKRRQENERRQSLIPHQQQQQEQQRVMNTDMNLSDSSSSEDNEDED